MLTPVDTLSRWRHLHPDVSEKQPHTRQVCFLKCAIDKEREREKKRGREREKWSTVESISGAFPCSRGPTIFPFSRSNQRSGVLATFDLRLSRSFSHAGSLLPARLSVILRTRLSAHSFTSPFFPPISSRRLEMFPSLSPACFPLPFFDYGAFLFNRYYAISRVSIGGTEKFRATQQFARFFYWLLSYFRHSKPARLFPSPFKLPLSFLCHSLYSSSRGG